MWYSAGNCSNLQEIVLLPMTMKINRNMHFSGNGHLEAELAGGCPPMDGQILTAGPGPAVFLQKRRLAVSAVLVLLCLSLIVVYLARRPSLPGLTRQKTAPRPRAEKVRPIRVASTDELLQNLRSSNLWDIGEQSVVPPVLFANLPQDMSDLDVATKKRAFISTLLPISLIAINEVAQEKKTLLDILDRLDGTEDTLYFDEEADWPESISAPEIDFLRRLARKYRTNSIEKLQLRVDVVPVSLILAQGALESSWGGSRFAAEGNNLFGIYTWGDRGMIPANRAEGDLHKVASYDSLLDSVRAYLLMINRLPAYTSLRELRSRTESSMAIAEGLFSYSERRNSYIEDVKQIIDVNELQRFDSMELGENFLRQPADMPATIISSDRITNACI
ncbi:MAG: glucosaminidase [Desulfurivibrio sp.]|nr:MAG: glucosaminidase [Desulfurivibrio sp.]